MDLNLSLRHNSNSFCTLYCRNRLLKKRMMYLKTFLIELTTDKNKTIDKKLTIEKIIKIIKTIKTKKMANKIDKLILLITVVH